jgi:hypothetical protein
MSFAPNSAIQIVLAGKQELFDTPLGMTVRPDPLLDAVTAARPWLVTDAAGGRLAGHGAGPFGGGHPQSRRAGKGSAEGLCDSDSGPFLAGSEAVVANPDLEGIVVADRSLPFGSAQALPARS